MSALGNYISVYKADAAYTILKKRVIYLTVGLSANIKQVLFLIFFVICKS